MQASCLTPDETRWSILSPLTMPSHETIARALAQAFLAGKLEEQELVDRASRTLGRRWRWLRPLARRLLAEFSRETRPPQIRVAKFILSDSGFHRALGKHDVQLAEVLLENQPSMQPAPAANRWQVPAICTAGELAEWLEIGVGELDWFADVRSLEGKRERCRLRHYHYRTLSKRFGQIRLIESPKPRLKQIQKDILRGILDQIPPHSSAHGFRLGKSIATFAAPHVGQRVVLKIDLQDFFPSISLALTRAVFRTVGYPEEVATLLAGLCTNATPADAWDVTNGDRQSAAGRDTRWLYSQPHLPQGAPTSPALANLCSYHLDCRLSGLADKAGAVYTRYADDLAFSGGRDFERVVARFHLHVAATVMEEGFAVHHRKTRIMREGVRQRLAGLVVNNRLNLARPEFDRLKATLNNCVRHGPSSQNREGHADYRAYLAGRLSFVEQLNPKKASRLRELFEQIKW